MAINSISSIFSLKKVPYYQEEEHQTLYRNTSESHNLSHDQIIRRKCIEEDYNNFFSIVAKQLENFKIQQLEKQNFLKHQIQIISNKSDNSWKSLIDQGNTYVQFFNSCHKGTQCYYNVVIGRFFLSVKVLNLHIDSSQTQTSDQCLGEGSYGKVKKIKLGDKDIALKRIYFNKAKTKRHILANIFKFKDFADHTEIKKAISQYCIYKICSLLKIGPQVIFENFYDLVIYNDCIQFQMELCQQVPKNANLHEYERDIKRCLRTLHSLKIIHKDLKKQNTLYSPTFNSYVLSDFGLTHSVKQNIWQKTQTYFGGSPSHASPEMMQLLNQKNTTGFINLYMNDIHCLKLTLTLLQQQIQYLQYSIVKNSMSYNDHYYDSQSAEQIGKIEMIEIIEQFNSDDVKLNSSSSLNSQQQSQTVEKLYIDQDNKKQQEILDRIGYYHIKALYQFLRVYQKYKKQNYGQLLQKIVLDIIRYQDNNQYLKIQILRIIELNVVKVFEEEDSIINQIRNSIRIFGINSKQLYDLLNKLNQKRTISFMNDRKLLQNYLNKPYKYNNISLNKFKNHITNMRRDLFLKNNKSAISNLRILITSYLADNSGKNAQRIQILKGGLIVLSLQQLKNQEFIQFAQWIWKIFSNKQVKEKQMDRNFYSNLVNSIYQQLALHQKVHVLSLSSLIKIHQNFRLFQGAKKYYELIKNQRQQLQFKFNSNLISQNVNRLQQIRQIIKYKLYQIQYLFWRNQKKQALQLSLQAYNQFTEYQLCDITIKINLLDYIVLVLTTTVRYQECQVYIEQIKIAIEQNCFSKKNTIEHGFLYNHMATIQFYKNNYVEALKNYERALECTDDTLRGPNYINFKQQTLQNISKCYTKLNLNQKALQYLQKCLQLTKSYMKYGQYEQQIRIIHYIIIFLFKLNRYDDHMVECINEVIKLKVQLIQTKRLIITYQESRMLPAFPIQIIKDYGLNQQLNMKVKKIVIAKTEYYFPTFMNWYIRLCQQICNFYINQKKSPSKALPYCWKILNCISRKQRTEDVYKKIQLFVQLLIKTNSARRAFKYLKKYFYQIPQKLQNLRIQSSKKLFQLSSDLDTNDQQFYKFIFKQKAVRNIDYLKATKDKLIYIKLNKFQKIIWEKKLLKIKNQMYPELWQTEHLIKQFQSKILQNQIQKHQKIIKKIGKKLLIVYNPQINQN